MGTVSLRLVLLLSIVLFDTALAGDEHSSRHHRNVNRRRLTFNGLFTHSHYPSIQFALEQVNRQLFLSNANLEYYVNETAGIINV